ncbi:MAG TPA: ATP-binding protein [Bryobacteraceae bacterium]|nr:ATP-binding protein [Bryobacteraceae bacterium]
MWAPHLGGGTPRGFGPCGDVLDCQRPLLFTHWERRYPYLIEATPLAEEGLLVPFFVRGKAVGTIWAIAHSPARKFDSEDLRLLESLGGFAAAAYQAVQTLGVFDQRQAALSLLEDSRRMQQELQRKEEQLESITDNMAAAVASCSRDFRYLWVSRAYANWLKRPKTDIEGRYIAGVLGQEALDEILPYMEHALAGQRVEYTKEVHFLGAGNRWIHAVYIPTRTHQTVDGWIAVVTDITGHVEQEQQLREANSHLARANEDLSHFAFAASHDLQEPLRMIATYSQLLVRSYKGPLDEETANCMRFITGGTSRMQQLLTDLLAYTRLIGESEEPASSAVNLETALGKALENCKARIDVSGATVTRDPLPAVQGYEPHFVQLLQNLVGNALKYRSEHPPRIHVSAAAEGSEWRLGVADNGTGIEPEYHDKIFGVFKRLHGQEIPGTGIGLAICQRIVERYGGRIWVESQKDRGATFYFTLPSA